MKRDGWLFSYGEMDRTWMGIAAYIDSLAMTRVLSMLCYASAMLLHGLETWME
jgi:hypothetical protein